MKFRPRSNGPGSELLVVWYFTELLGDWGVYKNRKFVCSMTYVSFMSNPYSFHPEKSPFSNMGSGTIPIRSGSNVHAISRCKCGKLVLTIIIVTILVLNYIWAAQHRWNES